MPELAEVEHHRRRWNPGLGQRIDAVKVHAGKRIFRGVDTQTLGARLTGQVLLRSWAHGKQMLFEISGGNWLGVHLGMTGELRSDALGSPVRTHDHLVLEQAGRRLVFSDPRLFGRVRFDPGDEAPGWWRSLPPELLSRGFTEARVAEFLKRRARAPIKGVLLMQEAFPGIGNWMADEILWRARVHPRTRAGQLAADSGLLWREIRRVAAGAMRLVAPAYSDPPASWLFPHRWSEGGRCPRDGATLDRAEIGGRTTAWCPRCQRSRRTA